MQAAAARRWPPLLQSSSRSYTDDLRRGRDGLERNHACRFECSAHGCCRWKRLTHGYDRDVRRRAISAGPAPQALAISDCPVCRGAGSCHIIHRRLHPGANVWLAHRARRTFFWPACHSGLDFQSSLLATSPPPATSVHPRLISYNITKWKVKGWVVVSCGLEVGQPSSFMRAHSSGDVVSARKTV